ncbi:hypothetical protein MYP_4293 [Sporocytophaga myxococcoides]|uniref:Lipoprotein n=1 Tax=Sporocytophaga myxococcoides TaxID=153721 RepID=A0A098LLN6_9BACT|nr:hypothetical protein [Sporocytophaga myxococcoides]GAL87063.1 hypothetical protein MYP_4293 [Sporocytophaga myxococcoides]
MKKYTPLFMAIFVACSTPSEKTEMKDTTAYSIKDTSAPSAITENNIANDHMTILAFHKQLQATPLRLNHNVSYTLPDIKEEDGKYAVYDPAYEEPVDQAVVSTSHDSIAYTSGDYSVRAVELKSCKGQSYAALLISELMGNFESYTLKVFRLNNEKFIDVTDEVLNQSDLNAITTANISKDDFHYHIDKNSINVKLNPSKLGPSFKESNGEDPILKTTEDERKKRVRLEWSSDACKFIVK